MTKQMAEQHLKFAIFGNEYQAKKSVSIETILAFLEKKKAEIHARPTAGRDDLLKLMRAGRL